MKRIEIVTKDGKDITLFVQGISSLEEVDTITVSDVPDREIVADTEMNEQPADIDQSGESIEITEDTSVPTVTEPPVEEIVEEKVEEVAPAEEMPVEVPVDAPADKSVIDDIVGLVTAEPTVEENAVEEIVEPEVEQVAVATDTNGTIEVKPAEEPKKDAPVDTGFTMV